MRSAFWLTLALAVTSQGCLASSASKAAPTAAASDAAPKAPLRDTDWARFRSHRFGLSIPFPEGKSWRIDDHSSQWLTARHSASHSQLQVRAWFSPTRISGEKCLTQIRQWSPDIPDVHALSLVDDRALPSVPSEDFDTHLWAGVLEPQPTSPPTWTGFVLAVGATGKQCVALYFTASSTSASPSDALAEQLEIGSRIVQGVIKRDGLLPTELGPRKEASQGPAQR